MNSQSSPASKLSPLYELLGHWLEQKWTIRDMANRLGIDSQSVRVLVDEFNTLNVWLRESPKDRQTVERVK